MGILIVNTFCNHDFSTEEVLIKDEEKNCYTQCNSSLMFSYFIVAKYVEYFFSHHC